MAWAAHGAIKAMDGAGRGAKTTPDDILIMRL
jgi:hypothetical protein